ncbi:uncharacterized protein A1O5_01958 [Cladophialophora psammophila CBS 110553]|uniref:C2H2-type domain-containing protein n=1 Tax=Cladophialophora psammophila CBS 110553 TaxID=1182543 RepID=W9X449_9EURO|nr:uncharacterized protein A1O5_01958 [Cladophialophora psammophila CBS 110553]EXJ75262.1 hypothetical protein A1O5_01958 [Cladophialophora psammophila CBS 110553]
MANLNPGSQQAGLGVKTMSNFVDLDPPVEKARKNLHISQPAWEVQPKGDSSQGSANTNTGMVTGWLKAVTGAAEPPSDDASEVASMYDRKAPSSEDIEQIPPTSWTKANPNAPHQHIVQLPAHSIVSTNAQLEIEKYWDAIRQVYSCPTIKCKRQFKTPVQFREHLLSSSHIGGQVTCPLCLKLFATTSAWVAHTESASKRCDIRNSANFNQIMREITGGVLGTRGYNDNGTVKFVAPKIEDW